MLLLLSVYLLAPEEDNFLSKALAFLCFLVFRSIGDYVSLDLFYNAPNGQREKHPGRSSSDWSSSKIFTRTVIGLAKDETFTRVITWSFGHGATHSSVSSSDWSRSKPLISVIIWLVNEQTIHQCHHLIGQQANHSSKSPSDRSVSKHKISVIIWSVNEKPLIKVIVWLVNEQTIYQCHPIGQRANHSARSPSDWSTTKPLDHQCPCCNAWRTEAEYILCLNPCRGHSRPLQSSYYVRATRVATRLVQAWMC